MNRKVESFKQTLFIGTVRIVKSYNKCKKCSLSAHNRFATRILPCR